ncbi:MAG: phosphomannomutase/phosphoglucomutase [candidate division WOR-3 bacterium]|uniref:Phosphomannomutase/phosphoglucomutase n=2 Tax=candidate division WOR-3 bacterium TaxID=2052148 RepID=A0A7V4E1W4_UNCW3
MKVNPYIFREYDIRGVADIDLNEEVVKNIGRAFGTILKRKGGKKITIGYDVRLSSERIKENVKEGVLETGIDVIEIGIVPTPLLYFSVFKLETDGGIQITGSHNPKEYNGMKLMVFKETLYGEGIQKLKEIIENEDFEKGKGKEKLYEKIIDDYIEDVNKKVKINKRFKFAVDPGNGTCGPVIEKLWKSYKIEFKGINMEPDGNFPSHLPDPTVKEYLDDLFKIMEEDKFDGGIGFDGDGDRIGIIDDKKRVIFGDKILAILSKKILKDYPGSKIIFDVKTSKGVVEYIKKLGGKPIIWKTGHSLVKAKLKEENAPIAGEMSGHIFFNDRYYGYDDAIYASIRIFELMEEENKKLSELHDEIPFYYSTPEIRVPCPDEKKFEVVEKIKERLKEKYEVIDIDGARIEFEDGFGLVRASNTQPVLVLRFEGKTEEKLGNIKEIILKELRKFPEVDLSNF